MAVKVASTCLQWPIVPRPSPSSHTRAFPFSCSQSSKKSIRRRGEGEAPVLSLNAQKLNRSTMFGSTSTLRRTQSYESREPINNQTIARSGSENLDAFSNEEFMSEMALKFQQIELEKSESVDRKGLAVLCKEPASLETRLPLNLEPLWTSDWQEMDKIVQDASTMRTIQWQLHRYFRDMGESAYCSMKNAFSSMLLIIRELHSYYSVQMQDVLFEDLGCVHKEMNAYFVWIFQQVFSQTPNLMVYVMILLANYTVSSLGHNTAASIAALPLTYEISQIKTVSSTVDHVEDVFPTEAELFSGKETMQRFISAPVRPDMEADDYRTEILYKKGLSEEPDNSLLLSNYAQFLYQVSQDYDSAEEYFQRALTVEPGNADVYNMYAGFLWRARNDLTAAEETYLEAIDAEPSNTYHAASYAHFLWNTGAEDTCFPISSPDASQVICA